MKKIVASVGLLAIGASSLQLASAQGVDQSKPWNVGLTLRGFYDDNINSVPDNFDLGGDSRESLGFEVDPFIGITHSTGPTTVTANYMYTFRWYENQPFNQTKNYDQNHTFNLALDHAFSERYRINVRDSFVIGQEPDMLRAGNTFTEFQRVPGDNIRNYGGITFNADLTREFGIEAGYDNAYNNYADHGATVWYVDQFGFATTDPVGNTPYAVVTSYSGLLDRIDQKFHVDGRWTLQPQTTAVVGYQFGLTDYIGDEPLFVNTAGQIEYSDIRNARAHYGYIGADHNFRPDLTAAVRGGVRYTDYYNDPNNDNGISPYGRLSIKYTYLPDSYADLGFQYDKTPTDLLTVSGNDFTRDSDTATVFGSINHRITPKLSGSLTAQWQNSTYNGGSMDGQSENFIVAGLNFQYRFTPYLAGEVGYSYDKLISDADRGFDRNRVYLGVTASY